MSTRTALRPTAVVTAGNMASNITSLVTILQSITSIGYAYSWTGSTPVGTMSVQVSNDYSVNSVGVVLNSGTWTTLELNYNGTPVASIPISGNTGNGFIDIDKTAAYAIRTVYTAGSGTGTLSVIVCGKVS